MGLHVYQHSGDCGAAEAHVRQWKVVEEEVHRAVEVGVRADGQHDEQISKHSEQVYEQKQYK